MTIEVKIHQGTARGDADLCASCSHCHHIRDIHGIEQRHCTASRGIHLNQKIAECNLYYNRSLPSLYSMSEIAWEIVSKGERGSRSVGFISPEDRRKAGISPFPPR